MELSPCRTVRDRVTAQRNHKTIRHTLTTTKSSSPSFLVQVEVLPSRLHVSQVSTGTFIPTNPDRFTFSPRSNSTARFISCLLVPDRSTHRGPKDLSDPFVKDRHTFHHASTDMCAAIRSTQEAFFHSFATLFRQPLSGTSSVYLTFSTRDILLQMYPPDIQHTPQEISEHKGAPFIFLRTW